MIRMRPLFLSPPTRARCHSDSVCQPDFTTLCCGIHWRVTGEELRASTSVGSGFRGLLSGQLGTLGRGLCVWCGVDRTRIWMSRVKGEGVVGFCVAVGNLRVLYCCSAVPLCGPSVLIHLQKKLVRLKLKERDGSLSVSLFPPANPLHDRMGVCGPRASRKCPSSGNWWFLWVGVLVECVFWENVAPLARPRRCDPGLVCGSYAPSTVE